MATNTIIPNVCMSVTIINPQQIISDQINSYSCTIVCNNQNYNGGNNQFTCADISVGMWVSNYPSGEAWRITQIVDVNYSVGSVDVIIQDLEYYNSTLDSSTGEHGPNDGAPGYVFSLNENGLPDLVPITEDITSISPTFITDLIGRFNSRNYYNSYVNAYQVGSNFQAGQFLYLDSSGNYNVLTSNVVQDGSIYIVGVVTSSAIPTNGYFTYRPMNGKYLPSQSIEPRFTSSIGTI